MGEGAPERGGEGRRAGRLGGRLRRGLLLAVALLFVVSVPWYRDADSQPAIWLGLPDWVSVALLCYGLAAILNAAAWLLTDLDDEGPEEPRR